MTKFLYQNLDEKKKMSDSHDPLGLEAYSLRVQREAAARIEAEARRRIEAGMREETMRDDDAHESQMATMSMQTSEVGDRLESIGAPTMESASSSFSSLVSSFFGGSSSSKKKAGAAAAEEEATAVVRDGLVMDPSLIKTPKGKHTLIRSLATGKHVNITPMGQIAAHGGMGPFVRFIVIPVKGIATYSIHLSVMRLN